MKAKLRFIEVALLSIMIALNAYLIYLNVNIGKYQATNKIKSTANYIQVEVEQNNDVVEEEVPMIEETEVIVYDNKTLDELTETLNKSLSSTLSGKGDLIASYSLEKGVDPYLATAIILHETGCKWGCSYLVRECNNVGGQKGSGCGSYSYFNSLDEGIKAFIDNLYNNYISYGLTTPEQMNSKYAEDLNWSKNVSKYIEIIRAQ